MPRISKKNVQYYDKKRELTKKLFVKNKIHKKIRNQFFDFWKTQIETIRRFTNNSAVKGEFLEKTVRSFIRTWIQPNEISSGYVLMSGKTDKQIDGIIWNRHRSPVVAEVEDMVILHPIAVIGILEIKLSDSNLKKLKERICDLEANVSSIGEKIYAKALVIRDNKEYAIIKKNYEDRIICLFQQSSKNGKLTPNQEAFRDLVEFIYLKVLKNSAINRTEVNFFK